VSAMNRGGSRGGGQGLAGIVGNPAPGIVSPASGGSRCVILSCALLPLLHQSSLRVTPST
jgi:hypothetical protein